MGIALFLVHGTFAPNADWTRDNSQFCRGLRERLKIDSVQAVTWSGANTTAARELGVSDLSEKLSKSLAENPSSKHVVIGHSHGGTIALHAVTRSKFAEKVGVVLLSTPFLLMRLRRITPALSGGLGVGFLLGSLIILSLTVFVIGLVLQHFSIVLPVPELYLAVGIPTIIFGITFLALFPVLSRLLEHAAFLIDRNKLKIPPNLNLLIARESSDEVNAFLSTFQFCVWSISRLFSSIEALSDALQTWMARAVENPLALRTLIPNIVMYVAAVIYLAFMIQRISFNFISPIWVTGTVALLLGFMMIVNRRIPFHLSNILYFSMSVALLALISTIVLVLAWFPMVVISGPMREAVLSSLLLDTAVEACPEGVWKVHQYVPQPSSLKGWQLAHSAAHDDPRVVQLIADWIGSWELGSTCMQE